MKIEVKNIENELAKVNRGVFLDIAKFNKSAVCAVDIQGVSPVWEMHPDTDELFYVIEGELGIELLCESGSEHYKARVGEIMVVPKSYWHKPSAPKGAKFMCLTPGQSLHSEADDPR